MSDHQIEIQLEITGQQLMEDGIHLVLTRQANGDEIIREMVRIIKEEFAGQEIQAEQIRQRYLELGHAMPRSPNFWGAALNSILRTRPGLLVETGRWERARSTKSRASRYPVYRVRV